MLLTFLGNGSGFSESHTGAGFEINKNGYCFIDCSMFNINKMVDIAKQYERIFLLITHMHSDHVSGLPIFAQKMFYVYNKKIEIIAPDILIKDIDTFLSISGVNRNIVDIYNTYFAQMHYGWFLSRIRTKHAPELPNKCFGYKLFIDNKYVIYSGDTCCFDDFANYIKYCNELYLDVSASYGKVHLLLDDIFDELLKLSSQMDIYLMHIDDIDYVRNKIRGTNIKIVEINENPFGK